METLACSSRDLVTFESGTLYSPTTKFQASATIANICDAQMVITSRSDSTKTYTYNQGNFDPILPADEYDVSFKDPVTGEAVYQSTNLAFSAPPDCVDYVTESSLFIAPPPPGYFPLYNRFNVSDELRVFLF